MKVCFKEFRDLSPDELYRILRGRQEVFTFEQGIIYQDMDFIDQESVHAFIRNEETGDICAYLRIIRPGIKYPESSMGRLFTLSAYRRCGLGREIMEKAISFAGDNFGFPIRIEAQEYLVNFYKSLGFKAISAPFILEGLSHVEMILEGSQPGEIL